jgi:type II secretory pathway pseudopilin PulG
MKNKKKAGFTLIEARFAAMLIGLVVAAIAVSSGAATMVNGAGLDMSTAEFLSEEIRERTATVSFDDLVANYNTTHNPPWDISDTPMTEFTAFSQQVRVEYVNPANLEQVAASPPTDFVRITVTITKNSRPVSSTSWIRARLN